MKKTVLVCDSCKKVHLEARTIGIYIESEMMPSGSSEQVWEQLDLCPDCMAQEIMGFFKYGHSVVGVTAKEYVKRFHKK